jgi:hypothetical protein
MPVEYPSLAELRLRELLDPVTAGVGDVDVALGVDRDAAGIAEPAVAVGAAPPAAQESAAARELLDPVVRGIGDIDVVVGVNRDAARIVEALPRAFPVAQLAVV